MSAISDVSKKTKSKRAMARYAKKKRAPVRKLLRASATLRSRLAKQGAPDAKTAALKPAVLGTAPQAQTAADGFDGAPEKSSPAITPIPGAAQRIAEEHVVTPAKVQPAPLDFSTLYSSTTTHHVPVQRKENDEKKKRQHNGDWVRAMAAKGVEATGGRYPYFDQIQRSFGRHDISGITAHTDTHATAAATAIGAQAYATGNSVAFADAPNLHTAAHEAAHVIQQRSGVSLNNGVGQVGDRYEQHANWAADAVVAGQSAEPVLDQLVGSGTSEAVQSTAVQMKAEKEEESAGSEEAPKASIRSMVDELRKQIKYNHDNSIVQNYIVLFDTLRKRSQDHINLLTATRESIERRWEDNEQQLKRATIFGAPAAFVAYETYTKEQDALLLAGFLTKEYTKRLQTVVKHCGAQYDVRKNGYDPKQEGKEQDQNIVFVKNVFPELLLKAYENYLPIAESKGRNRIDRLSEIIENASQATREDFKDITVDLKRVKRMSLKTIIFLLDAAVAKRVPEPYRPLAKAVVRAYVYTLDYVVADRLITQGKFTDVNEVNLLFAAEFISQFLAAAEGELLGKITDQFMCSAIGRDTVNALTGLVPSPAETLGEAISNTIKKNLANGTLNPLDPSTFPDAEDYNNAFWKEVDKAANVNEEKIKAGLHRNGRDYGENVENLFNLVLDVVSGSVERNGVTISM